MAKARILKEVDVDWFWDELSGSDVETDVEDYDEEEVLERGILAIDGEGTYEPHYVVRRGDQYEVWDDETESSAARRVSTHDTLEAAQAVVYRDHSITLEMSDG